MSALMNCLVCRMISFNWKHTDTGQRRSRPRGMWTMDAGRYWAMERGMPNDAEQWIQNDTERYRTIQNDRYQTIDAELANRILSWLLESNRCRTGFSAKQRTIGTQSANERRSNGSKLFILFIKIYRAKAWVSALSQSTFPIMSANRQWSRENSRASGYSYAWHIIQWIQWDILLFLLVASCCDLLQCGFSVSIVCSVPAAFQRTLSRSPWSGRSEFY